MKCISLGMEQTERCWPAVDTEVLALLKFDGVAGSYSAEENTCRFYFESVTNVIVLLMVLRGSDQ